MSDKKTHPTISDSGEEKTSHEWELLKKKPGVKIIETVTVQP